MTRNPTLPIERCLDDEDTLEHDVLDGLTRPFKELPPKHFYDARGSELFERICELPSYYPTRCETEILAARAGDLVERTGAVELVELGSGAAEKARILLGTDTWERYVPLDVSESALVAAAEELAGEHPDLRVHGVLGDFERHLDAVPEREGRRVVALLGGTIGNFPPGSRRRVLEGVAALLEPGDALLLGTDLVKDPNVLEAAYDDPEGVTAEFNRNLLHVLNERLDGDAIPEAFEHVAFFDPEHEWIEMRLRSVRPQRFTLRALDLRVSFAAAEELRTEISCKFTPERIEADLASVGLRREETWTDAEGLFALQLAVPA
jgi:L-histidine N-alpha-methyltransferase